MFNNFTKVSFQSKVVPRPRTFLMLVGSDFAWHGVERLNIMAKALFDFDFCVYGKDAEATSFL